MELPIFFNEQISYSTVITLDEDTSKHVVQVLRMKPNEQLQLTDGKGNLYTVKILDDHKKKCTVSVVDKQYKESPARKVSIAISLLKNTSRFEWFLEKATELGVTEIIPLLCQRTEKQHFRYDRMKSIVTSAMMQSKQAWLPVLAEPTPFAKVISPANYDALLIAHCLDNEKNDVTSYMKQQSVQILIGPEGDFTPAEIEQALQNGYTPVSLGETRLRTETAGVVAATVLCL